MRSLCLLAALPLLALGACRSGGPPPATDADLGTRMAERFEGDLGGVDGFTVLVGGFEVRYTRTAAGRDSVPAGAPAFSVQIAPTDSASVDPLVQAAVTSLLPDVPGLAAGRGAGALGEPFDREGVQVYALDATALSADTSLAGSTSAVVYVDARTFRVREVARTVRLDSLERPLSQRLLYDDYRTADGLTLPWRVRVIQSGLDQLMDETMRVVEGGQLGFQREQLRQAAPSPARDVQLAAVERRLRMLREGVEETTVHVRRVIVRGR